MAASKHTHARDNAVTLVWGSLRLAPITTKKLEFGANTTVDVRLHLLYIQSEVTYPNFQLSEHIS